MKFYKIFLIFLLFITFNQATFAISLEDKVLTLNDCIETALKNSPYIKKQKINYEMSKKDVGIAKSAYFPTLNVSTGYNFSNREGSSSSSTNTNKFDVQTSLKQLIWNFGKTSANIRMEKFNRITAYYNFDTQVLDTIFDVKVKYYSVLASKAALEVDKSNLQINERNYQRTKAYFDEGLKSKIDVVNAEVYVTQAKTTLIASQNAYKSAMIDLYNAMYMAYQPIYDIEVPAQFKNVSDVTPQNLMDFSSPVDDLLAPPKDVADARLTANVETTDYVSAYQFAPFPYSFEECLKLADENRPDLKAYNSTLKAMEQYLLVVKRNYFPELAARGSYSFDGSNVNSKNSHANQFGLGVELSSSVNILGEKYQIDNAKFQVDLAQNEIELLKQNVYFEVQKLYVNMMEYKEQIPLLEQKVSQTLENLELADGRYMVGLGDYIEVQDAKVNYNVAQHAFVKAVFNYSVAKAKLEKAIALNQEVSIKLEDKIK